MGLRRPDPLTPAFPLSIQLYLYILGFSLLALGNGLFPFFLQILQVLEGHNPLLQFSYTNILELRVQRSWKIKI